MNRPEEKSAQSVNRVPETDRIGEIALVKGILEGRVDDFEIIIRKFEQRITILARRHLHAEDELDDAMQDIFLRVYNALPRFKGRSNLFTWVYSIANNYLIDRLRKRRHRKISDSEMAESGRELESRAPSAGNPSARIEQSEDEKMLWIAMENIDPLFRNVLILREVEDLTYEEISETLGVGVGTVKSRLFRARSALKKAFIELSQAGNGRGAE